MLIQGILLGISLSFLIGPLLFTVVQAGIVQGFRAGMAVATGIWLSDMFFVAAILWGIESLAALTAMESFRLWAGVTGGLLLMIFGVGSIITKGKGVELAEAGIKKHPYSYWWLKGFLINTINPGTIFFWLGIVSAVIVPNRWSQEESLVFFGGMLGTLVLTDTLKAWAAKSIRRFLTPRHIMQVQQGIGLVLVIFGLVLIFRVVLIIF